jgi:hypothetical protein
MMESFFHLPAGAQAQKNRFAAGCFTRTHPYRSIGLHGRSHQPGLGA